LEPEAFIALLLAHKWLAASAVVIGLVVRLAKAGKLGKRFAEIPPHYRPVLAVALGALSAAAEVLAADGEPAEAIVKGIAAAAFAVLGHDVFIEAARGGRELGEK
jgi:hypothetical protein